MSRFIYNSIDRQNKKEANSLTINEWNNIINILSKQTNSNTKYNELLNRWLIGNENDLPDLKGKSLFEYISTLQPAGGSDSIKPIEGVLTEEELFNLYTSLNNGIYAVISETYGHEFIIINSSLRFFKRITGYHDYIYNFEIEEWITTAGAGTSEGNVILTLSSAYNRTLAVGAECKLFYTFKSTQSKKGTARYYINDVLINKVTSTISTGEVLVDLTEHIVSGTNAIKIVVTDHKSNTASIEGILYIGVSLKINAPFDTTVIRNSEDPLIIQYSVIGAGKKDIYMYIDGVEEPVYSLKNSEISGAFENATLNKDGWQHGVRTLTIYAESIVDGVYIKSNIITYKFIYEIQGNTTPIILVTSTLNQQYTQGDVVLINYLAYTPGNDYSTVTHTINDTIVNIKENIPIQITSWELTTELIKLNIPEEGSNVAIAISIDTTVVDFNFKLISSKYDLNPVPGATLNLTALGHNHDDKSNIWSDGNTDAVLSGFNWITNGWCFDSVDTTKASTVLRVTGTAKVEIPYNPFTEDTLRLGRTIELEFATRSVYDIYKKLITCYTTSGNVNVGISVTANDCILQSLNTTLKAKYKDNERIKVTFVILPSSSTNKLMYIYLNGIFSGFTKYTDTIFTQSSNIVINPDNGFIDIYSIRVYNKALSPHEIVHNYIIGLPPTERAVAITRNNILDINNQTIVIDKVKELIPVIIYKGVLPTTKDTGLSTDETLGRLTFINLQNDKYSFVDMWVLVKIQGTSSVGYPIKNYKVTILDVDENGNPYQDNKGKWVKHKTGITFYDGGVPEHTFTFKADYMESSHSHNTGNAIILNKYGPSTPFKETSEGARNTIYGYPVLFFVQEDETANTICYGVYNFNNDKGNYNTLGLKDNCESWEFKNNTSSRCKFKSGDFTSNVDNDFEARYPDGYTDYTRLSEVVGWVASTDTTATTNEVFETPISFTYDDNTFTFTADTPAYRLMKFKTEFNNYFDLDSCLFYTVMMDIMLATDSRAKNMFLDYSDKTNKWYPRWYDIDTTYGLNNEGELVFTYNHEQEDILIGNTYVYNGHDSVLWNNFNEVFKDNIKTYYRTLREKLTYDTILEIIEGHQISKISETMYNIDGKFKYEALLSYGLIDSKPSDAYMYAAQGNRLYYFKWWLYKRINYYLDSKHMYSAFTPITDNAIVMRIYSTGSAYSTFTITPYADAYMYVKYGANANMYSVVKAYANQPAILEPTTDIDPNDLDTYIYSSKNILSLGNLTEMQIGLLDITSAPYIRELIINDGTITNSNFNKLTLGSVESLEILKVLKCPSLTGTIDLSNCLNIREVYATGTSISSVVLPNGGELITLTLPATTTNINLSDHVNLSTLTIEGYTNLNTVSIVNCPKINNILTIVSNIISKSTAIAVLELKEINWILTSTETDIIYDLYNIDCVLTGTISPRGSINSTTISMWKTKWPGLTINVNEEDIIDTCLVRFFNADNTTICAQYEVLLGGSVQFNATTPTKQNHIFAGWDTVPNSTDAIYAEKDSIVVPIDTLKNTTIDIYPVMISFDTFDWTEFTIKPYSTTTFWVHFPSSCTNYVDWGDGSDITSTTYSYMSHTYDNSMLSRELTLKVYQVPRIDNSKSGYLSFTKNGQISNYMVYAHPDILSINKLQQGVYEGCPRVAKSLITSVNLPSFNITSIGDAAFSDCTNLINIVIPDSVTSIGYSAFGGCNNLVSINIPDSVTSIGRYAFAYCDSLTIYCEATSKPSGWDSDWNYSNCPVVWGYKGEE